MLWLKNFINDFTKENLIKDNSSQDKDKGINSQHRVYNKVIKLDVVDFHNKKTYIYIRQIIM